MRDGSLWDPSWMPPGSFPKHLAATPAQEHVTAAPSSLPKYPPATPPAAAVSCLGGPQEQREALLPQASVIRAALQVSGPLASLQLKRETAGQEEENREQGRRGGGEKGEGEAVSGEGRQGACLRHIRPLGRRVAKGLGGAADGAGGGEGEGGRQGQASQG